MSNNQSAKGLYKIPSVSRSSVRKSLLNIYSSYQDGVYKECLKCYDTAKNQKNILGQRFVMKEIIDELHSGEYVGLYKYGGDKSAMSYDIANYLELMISGKGIKKPMKKDFPTMPSLRSNGSRDLIFDSLESSVVIGKGASVIKITIGENNHNVDHAMNAMIGEAVNIITSLDTYGAKSGGGLVVMDEYSTQEQLRNTVGGIGERALKAYSKSISPISTLSIDCLF